MGARYLRRRIQSDDFTGRSLSAPFVIGRAGVTNGVLKKCTWGYPNKFVHFVNCVCVLHTTQTQGYVSG